MTTLKEIADLAGVSRGTVDRVLNHRGSVNPKTAEKVMSIEPLADKWLSFGWDVYEVDGHNIDHILGAISQAKTTDSPSVIIMRTVKGKGVSFMENNAGFHGRACKPEEYERAIKELKEVL